ncbi:hypothetical protein BKA63DRAFT_424327 [Paraphoma chrysanthemicola]|nr:hypothetical protein BKA63DRAFT_424327 [Paraphoma chrysanthemicola]
MAPGLEVAFQKLEQNAIDIPSFASKEPTITITSVPSTPPTPAEGNAPSDHTLVLNPSFITQEFDLLRFEAAAFEQLPKTSTSDSASQEITTNTTISTSPAYSSHLISSPYNNPGHYLDLTTLPLPSLLFAKALTALKPTTPTYATAPYTEALNFDTVLSVLRSLLASYPDYIYPETSFYVVTFRSQLLPTTDNTYLYQLDYESHREACESGGLLKYWFGKSDDEHRNLATCFWHSREDAHRGGTGPWHVKARKAGRELYEKIVFGTLRFTVEEGAKGWRVGEWMG